MVSVHNLLCVGDTHGGCQLALVPPDGVPLDNAGRYMPSPIQLKLWAIWREMWDEWLPAATDGAPFAVCHMGDALDGVHHGSTSQISHNLNDQRKIAFAVLKPIAEQAVAYYHIRGTPAHVGDSAMQEETLAQELGAIPNASGQYARYALYKWVGDALVEAMHHISTTGSQHYESTAVHKELTESMLEAGRWERRAPDVVVRGHRHRHIETSIPTSRGRAYSLVTPGWQLKTPFAFKIAGARQSEPQVGAVLIHWSERRGELFVRPFVRSLEREAPE